MSVRVGRQLRIDEDILGMDDEAIKALIWMGRRMLASAESGGLTEESIEQLNGRIEMFQAELARR